jgi:DNA-binding NtrC family response regulator
MMTSILARRILVVDSEPSVREVLRYLLACDGHDVEEAPGLAQAMDKLGQSSFDVVLAGSIDLEVKGDTTVPHIYARGGATPVLKMNCDPLRDPAEELRRLMFNPFDLDSIRQALAALQQLVGMN